MSIYGTTLVFDGEEHTSRCARMRRLADDEAMDVTEGQVPVGILSDEGVFQLVDGDCTCGGYRRAAIAYRGSHLYPDTEERTAEFDLGVIPGHIAEGGGDDPDHEHWKIACHRPFLRVSFRDPFGGGYPSAGRPPSQGTVLLDAEQVKDLRDELTDFLERITGAWCLEAEPVAERERDFAAFLETIKPVAP